MSHPLNSADAGSIFRLFCRLNQPVLLGVPEKDERAALRCDSPRSSVIVQAYRALTANKS